ncbi:DEAD/DEAH box helicase [Nonomuraea sp. NPDC049655]|uniref:DEAD/DEAH box helicase n=1 Tax=Nonomuraea sp. NPDC049655 TaxID=3364355 RepID=UPI0037ACF831
MSPNEEYSLHIGFDLTRTRVLLQVRPGYEDELSRLVSRFALSTHRSSLSAELDLDDFLAGISELATWPTPDTVSWAEDLALLVGEVLDDAEAAEQRISGPAESFAVENILASLGSRWKADLTDFQLRDIAKLLSLNHGANFSVPGAGKTRVALATFSALREAGKVRRLLVVCPKSAYESWEFESKECFSTPLRLQIMEKHPDAGAEMLIVNYERLGRSLASLASWLRAVPAMIVLDEAHRMKLGAKGTYGSACLALGPIARKRLILTGTPAPNGARDLESLLSFVWPGHGKRVVAGAVAGGDLAYASSVLRPLFTRTTKKELGLPPVDPKIRYVDMPPLHGEIYDALAGRFSARAEGSRESFDALGRALMRMLMAATSPALLADTAQRYEPLIYQEPQLEIPHSDSLYELLQKLPSYELSPKYEEARNIVAANAAKNKKTLVWSGFVRSGKTLERLLEEYLPAVVYGDTMDREDQLARFRTDPKCMVLVSNPATLGEGISLHQVCNDAVYVDRDFMAGRFLQSLDRIHRLGLDPEAETNVTVLATRATVDEVVARRLEVKLEFMGRILDDASVRQLGDLTEEPATVGGMDMQDVQAMLHHVEERRAAAASTA